MVHAHGVCLQFQCCEFCFIENQHAWVQFDCWAMDLVVRAHFGCDGSTANVEQILVPFVHAPVDRLASMDFGPRLFSGGETPTTFKNERLHVPNTGSVKCDPSLVGCVPCDCGAQQQQLVGCNQQRLVGCGLCHVVTVCLWFQQCLSSNTQRMIGCDTDHHKKKPIVSLFYDGYK